MNDLQNNLLNDGQDMLETLADEAEDYKYAEAGTKKLSFILSASGFFVQILGFILGKPYVWFGFGLSLPLGYYIFTAKTEKDKKYKYTEIVRWTGAAMIAISFIGIMLLKYDVI
jgi:hypothetical protein